MTRISVENKIIYSIINFLYDSKLFTGPFHATLKTEFTGLRPPGSLQDMIQPGILSHEKLPLIQAHQMQRAFEIPPPTILSQQAP